MDSCLLRFEPLPEPGYTGSVSVPIVLSLFRAKTSGSLLLSKKERLLLLHRLKGEAIIELQSAIQVPKDSDKSSGSKGASSTGTATTSGADTPVDGDSDQVALADDDGDMVDRLMEADACDPRRARQMVVQADAGRLAGSHCRHSPILGVAISWLSWNYRVMVM